MTGYFEGYLRYNHFDLALQFLSQDITPSICLFLDILLQRMRRQKQYDEGIRVRNGMLSSHSRYLVKEHAVTLELKIVACYTQVIITYSAPSQQSFLMFTSKRFR